MIRIAVSAIIGSVLGSWASVSVAMWLFALNAPNADDAVRAGYGFVLYVALAAGGVMGGLTAVGVVSRWPGYCIYCGAITAVIMLAPMLLALMPPMSSDSEFWVYPDLLALPLLLALSLLAWGVHLKRRQRNERTHH
jgi:hypothetical protein